MGFHSISLADKPLATNDYRLTMKVYHGSEFVVERPQFGRGKRTNDYGLGFYCTENRSLAGEWSVSPLHDGYVNAYEIDLDGLDVLNLADGSYTVLHWLAILLENRIFDADGDVATAAKEYLLSNFKPEYKDADVIIGYRANDSYFSFARTFLSGALSYANLSKAIRLGNLGLQVVLKSRKAFDRLSFLFSERAMRSEFLSNKESRDAQAREDFRRLKAQPFDASAIYMLNILQERIRPDDARLQ